MKEILHKGKSITTGEWVYGYLVDKICVSKPVIIIASTLKDDGKFNFDYIRVDPDTVSQFIGKHDMNCRRIFEGDILISAWKTKIVVFFDEDYLQFRAREVSACARENTIDYYDNGKMEVIGNIHDNPELVHV